MKLSKKQERSSNLELYRILVMLAIVAHHYVVNSGVLDIARENPTSLRSIYYYLLGAWGKVGINCFVLITGYFMCKSEINLQKFLKLFLEILFYMVSVNAVLIVAGIEKLSIREIWGDLQLITDVTTGFTSCFIMFYLFIPFINILIRNMNKKQHIILLVLCLTIFSGISTLMLGKVVVNYVEWFCILYLISSYIRLYQPMQNVRWGLVLGGAFLLSVGSVVLLLFMSVLVGKTLPFHHFLYVNNILAVVLSISMFMFFKDIKIPQSKWINRIAKSCFGVLLIHANSDSMRQWLWHDTLDVAAQYYTDTFVIHSTLSVLGVYIICTIIDQIRIIWLEKPFFKYLEKKNI